MEFENLVRAKKKKKKKSLNAVWQMWKTTEHQQKAEALAILQAHFSLCSPSCREIPTAFILNLLVRAAQLGLEELFVLYLFIKHIYALPIWAPKRAFLSRLQQN